MAEYKAFGHAIPGIIAPTLEEYTHLGDAASKTDGKIYNPKLGRLETNGDESGVQDGPLGLYHAYHGAELRLGGGFCRGQPGLGGDDDALAAQCLEAAKALWAYEQTHPVVKYGYFNTTGGDPQIEEAAATIQLVVTTKGEEPYKTRLTALTPFIRQHFMFLGAQAVAAIPFMDAGYKASLREETINFKAMVDSMVAKNPYGVPILPGTWAAPA